MTPSRLKYNIIGANSETHFFDRATMKFFGDTMGNFGVRSAGENWELYRKRPVKHGNKGSFYFNKETFARVGRNMLDKMT